MATRGKRIVNVAPLPSPSLSTLTVPPCNSARYFASESEPSPPAFGSRTVCLAKPVEHVRQEGRADPDTAITYRDLRGRTGGRKLNLYIPSGRSELYRVRNQIPHELLQPLRVSGDRPRQPVQCHLQFDRLGFSRRTCGFYSGLHHTARFERPHIQSELAGDYSRHVSKSLMIRFCIRALRSTVSNARATASSLSFPSRRILTIRESNSEASATHVTPLPEIHPSAGSLSQPEGALSRLHRVALARLPAPPGRQSVEAGAGRFQ